MPAILFLVAHPVEDASRRYRIDQFLPLLQSAGYHCTVSEFSTPQLFRALRSKGRVARKAYETAYCALRRILRLSSLSNYDAIVIHREAFPFFMPAFEKWVLRQHGRVIFSFDDAIHAGHADRSGLSHPWLYRVKYGRSIEPVIAGSCHVIAGNSVLAGYAKQFNSHVSVIPTVVDCNIYQYQPVGDHAEPLVVGWMGSPSTASYLLAIAPALRQLAETFGNRVKFRFVGCEDIGMNLPRSSYLPFDLGSELPDIRSLDIGIMPMPDTPWTRGKCAFKAIQYMAAGVPTIASPVGATLELIQHGENGFLAQSPNAWLRQLCELVNNLELRRRLSMRARRTVEERFSLQVWGPRFVSLIQTLCNPSVSRISKNSRTEPKLASSVFQQ